MKTLLAFASLIALTSAAQAGEVVKNLRTGRTEGLVSEGKSTSFITDPRTGKTLYTGRESGSSVILTDPRTGRTEAIIPKHRTGR